MSRRISSGLACSLIALVTETGWAQTAEPPSSAPSGAPQPVVQEAPNTPAAPAAAPVSEPPVDQPHAVTFVAMTGGLHWEATQHLRLQWDYAYEMFGKHDVTPTTTPVNLNANARQWFAQLWATLRL